MAPKRRIFVLINGLVCVRVVSGGVGEKILGVGVAADDFGVEECGEGHPRGIGNETCRGCWVDLFGGQHVADDLRFELTAIFSDALLFQFGFCFFLD